MFLDALLLVSDAQAITADAVSTNTIDLGNPTVKNRIGSGEPMAFLITIDVAADFTTADETYVFEVIQSANANLSSPDIIAQRAILDAAGRAAGARHIIPIPPGYPTKRYLGLNYNVGGTTPTVTVTAVLMPLSMAEESVLAYAKGYSI
jgi:hypothetical protein